MKQARSEILLKKSGIENWSKKLGFSKPKIPQKTFLGNRDLK